MKSAIILVTMIFSFENCFAQQNNIDLKRVIVVPVIFHVVYSDRTHQGRTDGGNIHENLDTTLILAELRDLQRDFMLLNTDTSQVIAEYKQIIGNANISFVLADTIMQSNGSRGIIRIHNNRNGSNLHQRSKIINPKKYFNVYIGDVGSFTPNSPWLSPDKDAVFLSYAWVGRGYRLLTHEAGHWFGLFHLWGAGGGKGNKYSCSVGDNIPDTPPQYEATEPNGNCIICPKVGSTNDKTCDKTKKSPANFNNFMDYSGCRRMFTKGQVVKLRQIMKEHRSSLWNSSIR